MFSFFYKMKVYCVFSLESPQRGNSNKHIQHTILNTKKKITLNYPLSAAMGSLDETLERGRNRVVNEPSVMEPLKVYCTAYFTIFQMLLHIETMNF